MYYAMLVDNRVIDIKEKDIPPKYPPTPEGKEVITVECDENTKVGMYYDINTGEFSFPEGVEIIEPTPLEKLTIAKENKINSLSKQCNEAINQGATITFTEGVSEPFTYTINDQANISEMVNAIVLGADSYPYHANNEECRMYSAAEIIMMYSTLSSLKTHHLTYYNQLRAYVNSLTTAEEVYEVQYGQDLTGEYLDKYNTLMTQAQEEISKVLAAMTKNG